MQVIKLKQGHNLKNLSMELLDSLEEEETLEAHRRSTQQASNHLQDSERLQRKHPSTHLHLGLPASRTVGNAFVESTQTWGIWLG